MNKKMNKKTEREEKTKDKMKNKKIMMWTDAESKFTQEKIKEKMREWYVIKFWWTMGSGKNEIKEVTILGRTVRWTAQGLEYEAGGGSWKRKVWRRTQKRCPGLR